MTLEPGDKRITTDGRVVVIMQIHPNFAVGVFEDSGKMDFWHLDGCHDDDPQRHLHKYDPPPPEKPFKPFSPRHSSTKLNLPSHRPLRRGR